MAVRIVIDSTSDLTNEEIIKYDLTCARLTISWDGKEYTDGVDMTKKEFFEKLETKTSVPTTSQVPVPVFQKLFKDGTEKGEEVVAILLASKLSGTYQSANIARDLMEKDSDKIHIVDGNNAAMGTALLIHEAVKLRDQGKSAQEIVEEIQDLAQRVCILAAVGTLKFLHRGGRLSGGAAVLGTLLSVKPILEVSRGEVKVAHKTRGNIAAYKWITEEIAKRGIEKGRKIMVGSTQCPDLLDQLVENLDAIIDIKELGYGEIGIVMGTHAGPGCVGCAFIEAKK